MKRYLVMAMRKPGFDDAAIVPHQAFLDALREAGQLEMTGGFSDRSGGAYVLIDVGSLEAARAIAARDPLVLHDASELTVYEWNTR